jgi:hypothetical protein
LYLSRGGGGVDDVFVVIDDDDDDDDVIVVPNQLYTHDTDNEEMYRNVRERMNTDTGRHADLAGCRLRSALLLPHTNFPFYSILVISQHASGLPSFTGMHSGGGSQPDRHADLCLYSFFLLHFCTFLRYLYHECIIDLG